MKHAIKILLALSLTLPLTSVGPAASADPLSSVDIKGDMDFYNTTWETHGGPFNFNMSCFFICFGTFSEELTGTLADPPGYYRTHRMTGILIGFVAQGATAEKAYVDSIFIGLQLDESSGDTLPFPAPTVQDKKFLIEIGPAQAHFSFADGANGTMPAADVSITP
jgi:hypothetical protein